MPEIHPESTPEVTPATSQAAELDVSAPYPTTEAHDALPKDAQPAAILRTEAAGGTGLAMKRRNPVGVWLGLPLITLGIYHLVWYYKIHKEMAEFDRRRSIPVAGPMLVLLLLPWTIIAPLVSYHNAGARVRTAQRSAGLAPSCSPALAWLLAFAFGLNVLYLQVELNKVVDRYASTPTGTPVPLFV